MNIIRLTTNFIFSSLQIIAKPFRIIARFIIQNIFIEIYKKYLLFVKRAKEAWIPAKNTILYPFSTKYVVHGVIIVLSLLVTSHNIWARNITGDAVGKDSLLYTMVSVDSEEIVETADMERAITPISSSEVGTVSTQKEQTGSNEEQISETQKNTTETGAIVKSNPTETEKESSENKNEIAIHTVKDGETLSQIAENYGISTATVLYENGLGEDAVIKPGQELRILPMSGVTHKVAAGQTLSQIAQQYSVDQEKIIESNKLVTADDVNEGEVLFIPGANIPKPTSTIASAPQAPAKKSQLATIRDIFFKAPEAPKDTTGGWKWPTSFRRINQYMSWRHRAIDIDANVGNQIYATQSGKIIAIGWAGGYGNRIVIDHGGGSRSLYGHLSAFSVKNGQYVSKGQIIGKAGNTGWSTGPHLHFELTIGGRRVNPLSYIR